MNNTQLIHITFERDFETIQEDLEFHYKEWQNENPDMSVFDNPIELSEYLSWEMGGFEYYLWDDIQGNRIIPREMVEDKIEQFVQNLLI